MCVLSGGAAVPAGSEGARQDTNTSLCWGIAVEGKERILLRVYVCYDNHKTERSLLLVFS